MINLKFLFGLYPSTNKLEEKEKALIRQYDEFRKIEGSEELKRYFELKAYVESPDFSNKKKEIESLSYKETDAYRKELEYNQLKKSKRIVTYYKVFQHPLFKNYLQVKDSDFLKRYFELKAFIESDEFRQKKENLKKLTYKTSDLFSKEKEFINLGKSSLVKNYYRVKSSDLYKNYEEVHNSDLLKRYNELRTEVESEGFRKKLEKVKNEKFEDTIEYNQLSEYKRLKASKPVKAYFKIVKTQAYTVYNELANSSDLLYYQELQQYLASDEFIRLKNDKDVFAGSEAEQKEKEWLGLQKNEKFKTYFKFINSNHYKTLNEVVNSGVLKRLDELETLTSTPAFAEVQKYYSLSFEERWKRQEESKIQEEYLRLKNDERLKNYFKFIESKEFARFQVAVQSGLIEKYEKLKEEVESPEFLKEKEYLLLPFEQKWQKTEEYKLNQEFFDLSSDERIKNYLTFISMADFKLYEEVSKTNEIPYFEELEKYIQSEDFKQFKDYMLLSFKEKWAKTDEHLKEEEFHKLAADEKIKWYLKIKDSHIFDELKQWKLTFFDDFDSSQLDTNRWLTRYYWGDSFLHDAYSLSTDRHFNTDGKNLSIRDSRLIIETRKEKITGKAWDPMLGFVPKDFEYTSGLVNTGKSFRQQYGRFRAKIRMSNHIGVTSAFWMVGAQIIPHIDIAKYVGKKLWMNIFWGNLSEPNGVKRRGIKLITLKPSIKEYIYELRWTPDELVWYINGLEIFRVSEGVPHEPMYIQLSCGVMDDISGNHLPTTMEIDWVKCYQLADIQTVNN
ncbi:MAG: family 16 glycosylhydrolase [Bacteroidales bacterium]|nr:family 16 glycosylhydrolase [Bacteroidales bacterium]